MILREQYEEHSERDFLAVPLAAYHFENVLIPLHWHRELELILTGASGVMELEGERKSYHAGDILCINKGLLHRTTEPMIQADLLVFDLSILLSPLIRQEPVLFLNQLETGALLFPFRFPASGKGYAEAAEALKRCFRLMDTKPEGWEWKMQTALLNLLEFFWENHLLVKASPHIYSPHASEIKESILFMKREPGQALSISQLAHQAALSPSHYIRVFRHYTGVTPIVFLNGLRLEKAAEFLRQGATVTEAALQVGIPNISYFIRIFRDKYALTPKQYQLQQSRLI